MRFDEHIGAENDIPRRTAEAAAQHPATVFHITAPEGIDDLILDLIAERAGHCVEHAFLCDHCRGTNRSGEK